jgi:hypothetical protein
LLSFIVTRLIKKKEATGKMLNRRTIVGSKTYRMGPRAGGCLAVVIGLIILAVGALVEWNMLSFLPGTVSTTGTILSCDMASNPDNGGTDCFPTVQFQTQAGQSITFKSSAGSEGYYVGAGVTVLYHPNHPQDARLDVGMVWIWVYVLGLLIVLIGVVTFIRGLLDKSKKVNNPGRSM